MRRLALLGCACLALVAVAAGCGGGGGTESSGGGEFAAEANAACARANQKVAALAVPEGEAELLPYLEETEAIVETLRNEIAALGGSSGGAAMAYLAGLEKSATVLNEMSNAARSLNLGAVSEFANELAALRLARLAEAAGLATCAKAPQVQP